MTKMTTAKVGLADSRTLGASDNRRSRADRRAYWSRRLWGRYALTWLLFFGAAAQLAGQSTVRGNRPGTESETIILTSHGFQPIKITRRPGPFLLSLHNATKIPSLVCSIEDSAGKSQRPSIQLGAAIGAASNSNYRDLVDLGAGTYTVRIKQLPRYTMTIVITPNGN